VAVKRSEVIGHGIADGFAATLQLGGCVEGGDEWWEFLVAVEEELYAAQAWLVGLELEAPFDCFGGERVIGRG